MRDNAVRRGAQSSRTRWHLQNVITILTYLRVAALLGQVLAIACAYWLFEGRLPILAVSTVVLVYGAWVAVYVGRTRHRTALDNREMTLELAVDLLVISLLLYFTGGWTNPFASIYLVPLAFAAALLPRVQTFVLGALALAAYALLVRFHQPLPSVHDRFGGDFALHVLGMWMSFVIGTVVLICAVSWVRSAHEHQRLALARERESRLRDEQLVALGALAASTAHELGTPLGTARLISEELEERLEGDEGNRIRALSQQLDYAIDRMRALVRIASHEPGAEAATPSELLARIVERFSILRPDVRLETMLSDLPAVPLCDTRLLESAILGLLINAANASQGAGSQRVELECRIGDDELVVGVRDYGAGLNPAHGALGVRAVPSDRGFGVGLVISSATFERYSGVATHLPADPGTRVMVSLPLAGLTAAAQ